MSAPSQSLGPFNILVIDKNLDEMADLIQRAYVMEKGRIVWQGTASALMHNEELKLAYLGI